MVEVEVEVERKWIVSWGIVRAPTWLMLSRQFFGGGSNGGLSG